MKSKLYFVAAACVVIGAFAFAALRPLAADEGDEDDGGGGWPMFNHDPMGTRSNPDERTLRPGNVSRLQVLWRIDTDVIAGVPAVQGKSVYVGDRSGMFRAVDARTGTVRWSTRLDNNPGIPAVGLKPSTPSITASALVMRNRVIIGDKNSGNIYGLDARTGAVVWKVWPNDGPWAPIWGSATQVGKYAVIGVSSNEESGPAHPVLTRGSVILLDPKDGTVVWQRYTVSDAEKTQGSTGATVWSTPTYDEDTRTIYVSTGNNFTTPTTGASDAVIALDAGTGAVKWVNQSTPNDHWLPGNSASPDFDYGDSPQVYTIPGGRKVVSAGQKSGVFHIFDAATGEEIYPPGGTLTPFLPGSTLGGFHNDSAVAHGVVFADGNYGGEPYPHVPFLPARCAVIAINPDGTEKWRFISAHGPSFSGVAEANGVVYFQPMYDPLLYALDARNGSVLGKVTTGGSSGGPAIADGHIYLGGGDFFGVNPPGVSRTGYLMSIGLKEGHEED